MNTSFDKEENLSEIFFTDTFDKPYPNPLKTESLSISSFEDFFSPSISNTSTQLISNPESIDKDYFFLQRKLGRTPKASFTRFTHHKVENNSLPSPQTHTKYFFDNILRKIKVLFHQFLVGFLNDCIKHEYPKVKGFTIKKLDGQKTQDITLYHNKQLLNLTLKETLIQFMSKKYKTFKSEENEANIHLIMQNNESLRKLFNMKYVECYMELFVKGNEKVIEQRFWNLLEKAATLKAFVSNFGNGEKEYLKKVKDVAKNRFVQHFQNTKLRKPKQKKF